MRWEPMTPLEEHQDTTRILSMTRPVTSVEKILGAVQMVAIVQNVLFVE